MRIGKGACRITLPLLDFLYCREGKASAPFHKKAYPFYLFIGKRHRRPYGFYQLGRDTLAFGIVVYQGVREFLSTFGRGIEWNHPLIDHLVDSTLVIPYEVVHGDDKTRIIESIFGFEMIKQFSKDLFIVIVLQSLFENCSFFVEIGIGDKLAQRIGACIEEFLQVGRELTITLGCIEQRYIVPIFGQRIG